MLLRGAPAHAHPCPLRPDRFDAKAGQLVLEPEQTEANPARRQELTEEDASAQSQHEEKNKKKRGGGTQGGKKKDASKQVPSMTFTDLHETLRGSVETPGLGPEAHPRDRDRGEGEGLWKRLMSDYHRNRALRRLDDAAAAQAPPFPRSAAPAPPPSLRRMQSLTMPPSQDGVDARPLTGGAIPRVASMRAVPAPLFPGKPPGKVKRLNSIAKTERGGQPHVFKYDASQWKGKGRTTRNWGVPNFWDGNIDSGVDSARAASLAYGAHEAATDPDSGAVGTGGNSSVSNVHHEHEHEQQEPQSRLQPQRPQQISGPTSSPRSGFTSGNYAEPLVGGGSGSAVDSTPTATSGAYSSKYFGAVDVHAKSDFFRQYAHSPTKEAEEEGNHTNDPHDPTSALPLRRAAPEVEGAAVAVSGGRPGTANSVFISACRRQGVAPWPLTTKFKTPDNPCLDLHDLNIGDAFAHALATSLRSSDFLQVLILSGNMVSASTCAELLSALHGHPMTEVVLDQNSLRKGAVEALHRALRHWTTLEALSLGDTRLSSTHACALLGTLAKSPSPVASLSLAQNNLNASVGVALAQLVEAKPSMQFLGLAWNQLGDRGTCALLSSPKAKASLRSVDLAMNSITSTAASGLQSFFQEARCLCYASVRYNKLGQLDLEALARGAAGRRSAIFVDVEGNGSLAFARTPVLGSTTHAEFPRSQDVLSELDGHDTLRLHRRNGNGCCGRKGSWAKAQAQA